MSKLLNRFKKPKYKTKPEARPMTEIQAEYADLRAKSGELQYQLYVYTKSLANVNAKMEELNYEAAERNKLDKEAAPKAEPQTTVGA